MLSSFKKTEYRKPLVKISISFFSTYLTAASVYLFPNTLCTFLKTSCQPLARSFGFSCCSMMNRSLAVSSVDHLLSFSPSGLALLLPLPFPWALPLAWTGVSLDSTATRVAVLSRAGVASLDIVLLSTLMGATMN